MQPSPTHTRILWIWLALLTLGAAAAAQPAQIQQARNVAVSDQKAGSVLVFPYYTSNADHTAETILSITHVGTADRNNPKTTAGQSAVLHLFLIDSSNCSQSDTFVQLTPNGSVQIPASTYDPLVTGYAIAVAVDAGSGCPIAQNVLIGSALLRLPPNYLSLGTGDLRDTYGAEAFWAFGNATCDYSSGFGVATLAFDGAMYDQMPNSFAANVYSPYDMPGQTIVMAGVTGDLVNSAITSPVLRSAGTAYSHDEKVVSYSSLLTGGCQTTATLTPTFPRVPRNFGILIPRNTSGLLKFGVAGGGVGLLLTPNNNRGYTGVRTLHKVNYADRATLVVPVFAPGF